MATFDAAVEVDDLAYDFTKFSSEPDAKGPIPEPSTAQVNDFIDVLKGLYPTKTDEKGETVPDFEAIKAMSDKQEELEEELILGIAALCSDSPSAHLIQAMPFRVQRAFFGFIMGVFSPQA